MPSSSYILASKVISSFLFFSVQLFLAQRLGVVNYGKYSYYISFCSSLSLVFTCGLDTLILREMPLLSKEDNRAAIRFSLHTSLLVLLISFTSFSVFLAVAHIRVLSFPDILVYSSCGVISLMLSLASIVVACLQSLGPKYAILSVVIPSFARVIQLLLLALVFLVLMPVDKIVFVCLLCLFTSVLTTTLGATLILFLRLRLMGSLIVDYSLDSKIVRFFSFGTFFKPLASGALVALSTLGINMLSYVSVYFMGFNNDFTSIAVYTLGLKISSLATIGIASVNTLFAPRLSLMYNSGEDLVKIQSCVTEASRKSFKLSAVSCILIILASPLILNFFGPAYRSIYPVLIVILIGYLLDSYLGNTCYILLMSGQAKSLVLITAVSLGVTVFSALTLISSYGAIGASFSFVIGIFTMNALSRFQIRRTLDIETRARYS